MSAREAILSAIRANRPKLVRELPVAIPASALETEDTATLPARFCAQLERMGGRVARPQAGADPLAALREIAAGHASVCSRVPELSGSRALEPDAMPASLADIDLAVVRAAFGVAETGSVGLTEDELGVNTLAYLAQHLLVLLDPADIVPDIQAACRRDEWRRARYAVLQTGPSATADIEGVLIHGAQGVRSLTVALLARGTMAG